MYGDGVEYTKWRARNAREFLFEKSAVDFVVEASKPFIQPLVGWWSRGAINDVGGGTSSRDKPALPQFQVLGAQGQLATI